MKAQREPIRTEIGEWPELRVLRDLTPRILGHRSTRFLSPELGQATGSWWDEVWKLTARSSGELAFAVNDSFYGDNPTSLEYSSK